MPNSTVSLQNVIDYAKTFGDIYPILAAGGYVNTIAVTNANDVMTALLAQRFNWKWNRFLPKPFYTISWQQDYAQLSLSTLAWIEHCPIVDINNTAFPKPIWFLEAVRDLEQTSAQYQRPGKICWLPNDQLVYGTWGGGGPSNPGPNTVYTNPLGAVQNPTNPFIQIKDTNGNLQLLTTYGTTGGTQPTWPAANSAEGTTTADGTVVWTVVNPKGQGFRVSPLPPQQGVVYQINPVCQLRPPVFSATSNNSNPLGQTLEPIPDDFAKYFRDGFVAYCYRSSREADVRAKHVDAQAAWFQSLEMAKEAGDRELEDKGFYPDRGVMDYGPGYPVGAANPYGWGWGWIG